MFTHYYPLEGQTFLIVDAALLLSFLAVPDLHIHMKKKFWSDAMVGLCWSVIVVATAAVQCIR